MTKETYPIFLGEKATVMKVGYDFIKATKSHIATAYIKGGMEVHSKHKKTKTSARKDLFKTLKSSGFKRMMMFLGNPQLDIVQETPL